MGNTNIGQIITMILTVIPVAIAVTVITTIVPKMAMMMRLGLGPGAGFWIERRPPSIVLPPEVARELREAFEEARRRRTR